MHIFERLESEVRSYCRAFPAVFTHARAARIFDETGRSYIDFFSSAGSLNYGHNNPRFKRALLEYVESDGVIHTLDMATAAKRRFLERFEEVILAPRRLDYKLQFPGPTGTNAVEAALKLARKIRQRSTVVAFTNAFHGVTLGSLAATAAPHHRGAAGVPLRHVVHLPFDGYRGAEHDTAKDLEAYLDDPARGGKDAPAAILLETVQAEGGIHPAGLPWLRSVAELARRRDILLIVDDIQTGCGRTGPFFSFESAGIEPDIVCLSKSLSGYGLPFSLVLIKRELDRWRPGEHNGTFRGHNLAFVTAAAALDYWRDDQLSQRVLAFGRRARQRLEGVAARYPEACDPVRGRGLMLGLPMREAAHAGEISRTAFERGLLVETCGPHDEVVKLLPPLTLDESELDAGLDILEASVTAVVAGKRTAIT